MDSINTNYHDQVIAAAYARIAALRPLADQYARLKQAAKDLAAAEADLAEAQAAKAQRIEAVRADIAASTAILRVKLSSEITAGGHLLSGPIDVEYSERGIAKSARLYDLPAHVFTALCGPYAEKLPARLLALSKDGSAEDAIRVYCAAKRRGYFQG
ncbi:hypothetical protein [Cupriavidus oxalaticus]|uniref:Uncharacterized protein n=1 Tax=Cupriavidus oxalaticus TaxID=96344 RepID=A0A5P3VIH5_9BURK|nr:hypothetical protein [Cupriavidus oxalaticus]QEZ46226.1 hypothetical protein D2917_18275 [Cupriavidus oxalaticus]